jgi:hypothetical protein
VRLASRLAFFILVSGISGLTAISAFAQTREGAITVRYTLISPFIALIAGILILIIPRLLSYVVAIYLILVGLIGIFGR